MNTPFGCLALLSSLMLLQVATCLSQTLLEGRRPEKARHQVTMVFGGDCLLAGHFGEPEGDDPDASFDGLSAFRDADVAMVNLECPVTVRGSRVPKPFNFRMRPETLRTFVNAGIDIVNIANNHIFDYGSEGLFDTILYLDSIGIGHVGAGRNQAGARRPVVVTRNGWTIGFLGYYGGGESPAAAADRPGVAARDLSMITEDIARLKSVDSADFVVVNLHWGTELATIPDPSQRLLAHAIIDAGADAVIGHHPHVLQGIEIYRSGVIAYSLGNLMFGGNSRDTYQSGLFRIHLDQSAPEYSFVPVGVDRWKAAELRGADSLAISQMVLQRSAVFPNSIFTR